MNTFAIRAEASLTFGFMVDPPLLGISSYIGQTVDTEFIASRNSLLKVSFRGGIYLLDFSVCEPACGGLVAIYLIDIIKPHLTSKHPDPMIHLLSQTKWLFDLPKAALVLSDSLLLLVSRTDPSSFRLMLLADPDNYRMTPGIEVKCTLSYKQLQSSNDGLLFVLNQDDSLEVFKCTSCGIESLQSQRSEESSAPEPFDKVFSIWQHIEHGLSGVRGIRVQQLQGGLSYLFVFTASEFKVFLAHSGSRDSIQWATRYAFMERGAISDEAAKILDLFVHSEKGKFLRPSSKLTVVSSKRDMIHADTHHFCYPSEQVADHREVCAGREDGQVRLDWEESKEATVCPTDLPQTSPLEQVTWASFCLAGNRRASPADESDKSLLLLKQQLQSSPIFGTIEDASLPPARQCRDITSPNRCSYRAECTFNPTNSTCGPFEFSAVNRYLAQASSFNYYETGRLAWELLAAKNLQRSSGTDHMLEEVSSSSHEVVFKASEKIER